MIAIGSKVRWPALPDAIGEVVEIRGEAARVRYGKSHIITWLRNLTIAA